MSTCRRGGFLPTWLSFGGLLVRGRFSDGRERMSPCLPTYCTYCGTLLEAAGAREVLRRERDTSCTKTARLPPSRLAASSLFTLFTRSASMSSVGAGTPLIGLGEASRAVGTGGGAGTSVRVTGRLVEFDAATACALIEHRGEELSIDVSALGGSRMRQGELLQFIGEAFPGRHGAPQPYVRARIVRNVDNLDMQTYEKAVLATRAFIDGLAG